MTKAQLKEWTECKPQDAIYMVIAKDRESKEDYPLYAKDNKTVVEIRQLLMRTNQAYMKLISI